MTATLPASAGLAEALREQEATELHEDANRRRRLAARAPADVVAPVDHAAVIAHVGAAEDGHQVPPLRSGHNVVAAVFGAMDRADDREARGRHDRGCRCDRCLMVKLARTEGPTIVGIDS